MSANVIAKIDTQINDLSPEDIRCKALISLRDFRTSWVELGRHLTDIAYGGDYKEWGYEDFEVYCASELGLKKPTVKKLMVSYNYLKSYEPEKLIAATESKDVGIPDYQTLELLKKARERDDIEEEEKEELHRIAFEGDVDQTNFRKEIKDRMKPADLFDIIDKANFNRRKEIEGLLRLGRNLRKRLYDAKSVPEGVKDRVEEALCELEALE